jgi:hypothetical protein
MLAPALALLEKIDLSDAFHAPVEVHTFASPNAGPVHAEVDLGCSVWH